MVILGAGAAGTAAAKILVQSEGVNVQLIGVTGQWPYNRTLVNKGVAAGLIEPAQASLAAPDAEVILDTARATDASETNLRSWRQARGARSTP